MYGCYNVAQCRIPNCNTVVLNAPRGSAMNGYRMQGLKLGIVKGSWVPYLSQKLAQIRKFDITCRQATCTVYSLHHFDCSEVFLSLTLACGSVALWWRPYNCAGTQSLHTWMQFHRCVYRNHQWIQHVAHICTNVHTCRCSCHRPHRVYKHLEAAEN